ncbi:MAG: ADP-forming succinate--CoA ligase subunit beta [Fimbriimonadaceae bacterium]|nr:ADP-forming succinate--CoA ligase subunit beta [Fimbriimonadaceae bacterium]
MKIHEYQGKQIFARYGVPIPKGQVAATVDEVVAAAEAVGYPCVVKAQVHVGGRGKAGGVKLAADAAAARGAGEAILGMDIKGLTVQQVLVEEAIGIAAEYYLGITLDRANQRNVLIVSAAGGIDIEEVAAKTPEKVLRVPIDPAFGLLPHQITAALYAAGIDAAAIREATRFIKLLDQAYRDIDASLAEINPLVLTTDGRVVAADAKINIDDNALFRHKELAALSEDALTDPLEIEAHRRGLQFVRLEAANLAGAAPAVGVIGNGAGLVMGTLDEVTRVGAPHGIGPANFLDIGGGARAEVVRNALELVVSNPDVRGVFINIFGGITRCDEVAKGILEATGALDLQVPLVIRLTGTNEDEGRRILAEQSSYQPYTDFGAAAAKIVELVAAA